MCSIPGRRCHCYEGDRSALLCNAFKASTDRHAFGCVTVRDGEPMVIYKNYMHFQAFIYLTK